MPGEVLAAALALMSFRERVLSCWSSQLHYREATARISMARAVAA